MRKIRREEFETTGESDSLQRLMSRCYDDPSAEPAFFAALLEAPVYAHKPAHDTSANLRLVQFPHPSTGAVLLPFFTDLRQARSSSITGVEIVKMTGRALFEITLGATLILNPNSRYCIFYPEEVRLLLQGKMLAPIQRLNVEGDLSIELEPATDPHDWLTTPLHKLYSEISGVDSAALARRQSKDSGMPCDLVVVATVSNADAERVIHATTVSLDDACTSHGRTVDVLTIRPDDPNPWAAFPKFYIRSEDASTRRGRISH